MSGTSCDGVDAVLAAFHGAAQPVECVAHVHVPFPPAQRDELQGLMQSAADEIERMGRAANRLAQTYAHATLTLIEQSKVERSAIAAIGAHGQTIRHRPEAGFSLQLNAPAKLAELTGMTVVADFRSRDVAAGGQGAPLVPAFHQAIFQADAPRAVVNIGGIANVTLLPARRSLDTVRGFDTGPGNTLMDAWCAQHTGQPYDADGAWGASGVVQNALLERLLADAYFQKTGPKSTGRETFHASWLQRAMAGLAPMRAQDVQATLRALTAQSIRAACGSAELFVCGGGAHNAALMRDLSPARSTAALGVDPMHVEALAFAWLAQRCLAREPGNLPSATGARGERILGAIYPA
jgi:anhydro-N-acetylmuramic acid kinase